ncbi:MAG: 50S ribosomal protein L25 [Synergistaceae bacterium]
MAAKKLNLNIEFTKREKTGTGACRKLRSKNVVPAVLYGEDFKTGLAGTVLLKTVAPIANNPHRETMVLELTLSDGTKTSALIRDVQLHPLTQQIRHIDFYEVVRGHKIKVEVPVELVNTEISKGVKDGGLLNFETRIVAIEVLPRLIPEKIEVDVKDLELGAEVFVKDLPMPEDSKLITDGDALVLHITVPKAASDDTEEDATTEVEVVAKGKAPVND